MTRCFITAPKTWAECLESWRVAGFVASRHVPGYSFFGDHPLFIVLHLAGPADFWAASRMYDFRKA